jgi:dTDP-4-dehydrorhamnose 3,5-epimerase
VIEGVKTFDLVSHCDERGSFIEIFQAFWDSGISPVQWSAIASKPKVMRGPHLHLHHDEYFMLLKGRATVGLRDIRPESPTQGQVAVFEFDDQNLTALCFPRGIIHGWYFHQDSMHIQAVSESYQDYNLYDNHGCYWADPELGINWGIDWQVTNPILSTKANAFPYLKDLIQMLYPSAE